LITQSGQLFQYFNLVGDWECLEPLHIYNQIRDAVGDLGYYQSVGRHFFLEIFLHSAILSTLLQF